MFLFLIFFVLFLKLQNVLKTCVNHVTNCAMSRNKWQSHLHGKMNLNIVYSYGLVNTLNMVPGSIRFKITQSGLKSYISPNSLSTGTQSSRSSSSVRSRGVVDDDLVGGVRSTCSGDWG